MPTPHEIEQALRDVTDHASFVQRLLVDTLHWDLLDGVEKIADLSYGWTAAELRAHDLDQHLIGGQAWQLRPVRQDSRRQPDAGLCLRRISNERWPTRTV
jgi:hypothetical protein